MENLFGITGPWTGIVLWHLHTHILSSAWNTLPLICSEWMSRWIRTESLLWSVERGITFTDELLHQCFHFQVPPLVAETSSSREATLTCPYLRLWCISWPWTFSCFSSICPKGYSPLHLFEADLSLTHPVWQLFQNHTLKQKKKLRLLNLLLRAVRKRDG